MSKTHVIFAVAYILHLGLAYYLKKIINKITSKAIEEKKLCSGIFSMFPVEGERAIELANGYRRAAIMQMWFSAFFMPFIFFIARAQGAI